METVTFCANQLSMFNFFISKISTLYMYTVYQEIKFFFIYLILQNRYTLNFEQFNNNEDLFKKIN